MSANDKVDLRKEGVPVVFDGKRYGYRDSVHVEHIYAGHNGNLYFYHPSNPPWELSERSAEPLVMTKKQARSLRDQLNEMDLDDPKEK